MARKIRKNVMRSSKNRPAIDPDAKGAVRLGRFSDYANDPRLVLQTLGAALAFFIWVAYVGQALFFNAQMSGFQINYVTLLVAGLTIGIIVRNISQAAIGSFLGLILVFLILNPNGTVGAPIAFVAITGFFITQVAAISALIAKGFFGERDIALTFVAISIFLAFYGMLSLFTVPQ